MYVPWRKFEKYIKYKEKQNSSIRHHPEISTMNIRWNFLLVFEYLFILPHYHPSVQREKKRQAICMVWCPVLFNVFFLVSKYSLKTWFLIVARLAILSHLIILYLAKPYYWTIGLTHFSFIPINSTTVNIFPTLEPQFLLFLWFCFSSHSQAYSGCTELPCPLFWLWPPASPGPSREWRGSCCPGGQRQGVSAHARRRWEPDRRDHRDFQACVKFLGWKHLCMLKGGGREPHEERMKVLDKRSKMSWRD